MPALLARTHELPLMMHVDANQASFRQTAHMAAMWTAAYGDCLRSKINYLFFAFFGSCPFFSSSFVTPPRTCFPRAWMGVGSVVFVLRAISDDPSRAQCHNRGFPKPKFGGRFFPGRVARQLQLGRRGATSLPGRLPSIFGAGSFMVYPRTMWEILLRDRTELF